MDLNRTSVFEARFAPIKVAWLKLPKHRERRVQIPRLSVAVNSTVEVMHEFGDVARVLPSYLMIQNSCFYDALERSASCSQSGTYAMKPPPTAI
jgi:hypothetical protein